jgi:hypothetical protein
VTRHRVVAVGVLVFLAICRGAFGVPAYSVSGVPGYSSRSLPAQSVLDDKLAEPPFAKFYQGVRACLNGTSPECLTQFLDATFVFQPWWQPGDARIPRAEFARFAHGVKPPGARQTLWQMIAATFSGGRVRELDGGVLFYGDDIECRAYELRDAYTLTHCDGRE